MTLTNKRKKIIIYTVLCISCIASNLLGRYFSDAFTLPLWMDTLGTVVAAYVTGIWGGLFTAVSTSLIYSFAVNINNLYYIPAVVVVAILAGIWGHKNKCYRNLYANLSAGIGLALAACILSLPFNYMVFEGMTGNFWGNTVIKFMLSFGMPEFIAYFVGEFYLDFFDKLLVVFVTTIFLDIRKHFRKDLTATLPLFIFLMLSAFGVEEVCADEDNIYSFVQTVYNSENGLPCGTANDVIQTDEGYLWIATYAGLYKYNGREYELMDDISSIKNANCLYEDSEKRLWVGTNDNGLTILKDGKVECVFTMNDGLPSNSVRSVIESEDHTFYVGTSEQAVRLEFVEDNKLSIVSVFEDIRYASDSSESNGYIAMVAQNGFLYLVKGNKILQEITEGEIAIVSCCFRTDNELLIGNDYDYISSYILEDDFMYLNKTIHLVEGEEQKGGRALNTINTIYCRDENTYICAGNGIGYINKNDEFYLINSGNFNNSITNMCFDYQENIWFSSTRLGLLKLSRSNFSDIYTIVGLEDVVVNATTMYNGLLYVGTDNGLNIIDLNKKTPVYSELTEMLASSRIRCVYTDSKNKLWICTYGMGLVCVDGDKIYNFSSLDGLVNNNVRAVTELSDGRLLIAQTDGMNILEDNKIVKRYTVDEGLGTGLVLCFGEMEDGTILAGTDGSGIACIRNYEIVENISIEDGLSSGVILRMIKYEDKGFFIVTSNGLCFMDKDYNIRIIEDFPYFNNYDIKIAKSGKAFVSGSAGIYVVDCESILTGVRGNYILLNAESGLTSTLTANAWNYLDEEENLFLATNGGVYSLNLNHYSYTCDKYIIILKSIEVDGIVTDIRNKSNITLGSSVQEIKINPEILNYSIDKPYVSIMLEGYQSAGSLQKIDQLLEYQYASLPYGNYTLHLKVYDGSGNKLLTEYNLGITKEMEYYENTWFKVYFFTILALMLILSTWIFVRYKTEKVLQRQEAEIKRARKEIEMGNQTILAIAKTVDAKDEYTSHHSQRVSEYSVLIAKEMGLGAEECENMRKAALLHDIGKIGIPDAVLNKKGGLSDEEYNIMKQHVVRGGEILKDFTLVEHVADGAMYHHEHYDGSGYVMGLKGEEIPLYARIIAIADTFDAMTSNRVYRKHLAPDIVIAELKRCRGTQFDPQITDIFLKLIEEGKVKIEE